MKKVQFHKIFWTFFFPLSIPKVVYLRPFLSSLPFPKFWKQNFMFYGHKHLETGPNCSHELATFLKYHMSLNKIKTFLDGDSLFKINYNYMNFSEY